MAAEVSIDFDAVVAMAEGFENAARTLDSVDQTLQAAVAQLQAADFTGMVGAALANDYMQSVQPQFVRAVASLAELHADLLGAIASLRDGDFSGSQRFAGDGGIGGAGGKKIGGSGGAKKDVDIDNYGNLYKGGKLDGTGRYYYQDGKGGWETIPIGGDFQPNELLVQQYGETCVVYSALNLMIENGYDVQQPVGDLFLMERVVSDSNKWADFAADGDIDTGFPTKDAKAILDTFGVSYQHGDFDGNSAKAEKFLINQLKAGHPVWVTTELDDSFGSAKGAHAETVIGVQVGKDGRLSSVLVATNSGAPKVVEIPAKAFLDDWLDFRDGEYIVVTKPK